MPLPPRGPQTGRGGFGGFGGGRGEAQRPAPRGQQSERPDMNDRGPRGNSNFGPRPQGGPNATPGQLTLNVTAKTYRYLDEEDKAAAAPQKKARKS